MQDYIDDLPNEMTDLELANTDQDDDMNDGDVQAQSNIQNLLYTLGVEHERARRVSKLMVQLPHGISAEGALSRVDGTRPATIMEAYGWGSIVKAANRRRNLNIQGLHAMDLRTEKPLELGGGAGTSQDVGTDNKRLSGRNCCNRRG